MSHLTVADDLAGVIAILDWLAFVPKVHIMYWNVIVYCTILFLQHRDAPLPIMLATDPVDRIIQYIPTKAPYDPRWMLAGRSVNGQFSGGRSMCSNFSVNRRVMGVRIF